MTFRLIIFIVLLYYIIDVMFNFLILLKMINYLSSLPPELYDPLMVSLKSIQSNFILIEWFYLVRMEEIHV